MAIAVSDFLGLGLTFGPGLSAATGIHPGGEHHADDGPGAGADAGAAPNGVPPAASSLVEPADSAPSAPSTTPSAQAAPVTAREG
jgi:hypothetical protein